PWLSYGDHAGSSGGLREGKGTIWEGGIRVPFVACQPGTIPAGTVHNQPAMSIDLLPTIASAIGAALPNRRIDGTDIGPWLRRPNSPSPDREYWHYYLNNELQAVRIGNWKLVLPHTFRTMDGQAPGKAGTPGKYRNIPTPTALFDLSNDPGERNDLAHARPLVVRRLMEAAGRARRELG
ncbi:MAG: sulfatase-like hydrolase/transferase, partial [Armatimonadaceae bacterium]